MIFGRDVSSPTNDLRPPKRAGCGYGSTRMMPYVQQHRALQDILLALSKTAAGLSEYQFQISGVKK
jgi:hypothetical protein